MASVFAWRDFGKKTRDLYSNYFPSLGKDKNLEDSVSLKVSSKAQKGVEFESSATVKDQSKTEAEFSTKLSFDDLEGVQVGFKAKNKPALELSLKFSDKIVPLEGSSVTVKGVASGDKQQAVSVAFAYKNDVVNVNASGSIPVTKKFVTFLADSEGEKNPLDEQKVKLCVDFVAKPVADKDYYVGGTGSFDLPKGEGDKLAYEVKGAGGIQNGDMFGAVYVKNSCSVKEGEQKCETGFGGLAYTKADDLSVASHFGYTLGKSDEKYKGVSVSFAAGLQRDDQSEISAKVNVIPDTIVSLGTKQNLNDNIELNFGYAFLLMKQSGETKTKSSAFRFGLELSH